MPRMILDIWHGERGIDLSKWKNKFGLWGVIVKCGGSDDPRLGRFEETTWVEQVTQAHALGLHVGAYYYSDATDAAMALADAKHCVHECMRGMTIDMPIYLDIEERKQLDLPMWQLTEVVTTFCNYVRDAGYQVGIYSGYEGFHNMHEDEISSYSLWVAGARAGRYGPLTTTSGRRGQSTMPEHTITTTIPSTCRVISTSIGRATLLSNE